MTVVFRSIVEPEADSVKRLEDLSPDNPFFTVEYMDVRRRLGATPCLFFLDGDAEPQAGCLGYLTRGRLNSRLEITSLPVIKDETAFWSGLFDFCKTENISVLSAHTFGSRKTAINETRNRTSLKRRSEYRLDLLQPDLWDLMNRRHHRLIRRARTRGLSIRRDNSDAARDVHVGLANESLQRRRAKGERIEYRIEREDVDAFIECGSGELVQAVIGDDVHATMLVARSRIGGYAQSSGTSLFGRDSGASHFLFHQVAVLLKKEGAEVFNLGGADQHSSGLQEFKLGLGAEMIELESAEFYTGSALKRIATGAISVLKGITLPI